MRLHPSVKVARCATEGHPSSSTLLMPLTDRYIYDKSIMSHGGHGGAASDLGNLACFVLCMEFCSLLSTIYIQLVFGAVRVGNPLGFAFPPVVSPSSHKKRLV